MQPIMLEYPSGAEWRLDGKLHRTDGPAIEWENGDIAWCLHGEYLTFDEWLGQTPGLTGEGKVMFKLEHG
tara:strand:+ start:216 stop:425 length:210 start_codon:yes stop_codon:yes gene_type:complete